jgi:hypothetical protein
MWRTIGEKAPENYYATRSQNYLQIAVPPRAIAFGLEAVVLKEHGFTGCGKTPNSG